MDDFPAVTTRLMANPYAKFDVKDQNKQRLLKNQESPAESPSRLFSAYARGTTPPHEEVLKIYSVKSRTRIKPERRERKMDEV